MICDYPDLPLVIDGRGHRSSGGVTGGPQKSRDRRLRALLKAHQAGGPMAAFKVQYLYMTCSPTASQVGAQVSRCSS